MEMIGSHPAWFADAETEMFVEVSPKALEIFGYTREEFLRMKPADIVVREEQDRLNTARKTAANRWGLGDWWTCRRKDGSTFRMQCRFHMQEFRGRMCYLVILVDMQANPLAASA